MEAERSRGESRSRSRSSGRSSGRSRSRLLPNFCPSRASLDGFAHLMPCRLAVLLNLKLHAGALRDLGGKYLLQIELQGGHTIRRDLRAAHIRAPATVRYDRTEIASAR